MSLRELPVLPGSLGYMGRPAGVLLLASLALGLSAGGEEAAEDPIVKRMKAYRSGGKTVTQGFVRTDMERVIEGARAIVAASEGLGGLYPVPDDDEGARNFKEKSDAMAAASARFLEQAQKVDPRDTRAMAELEDQFLDRVRGACLACHAAFWVTYECDTKHEKWTQAKWKPKHCSVCGTAGCGTPAANEEED